MVWPILPAEHLLIQSPGFLLQRSIGIARPYAFSGTGTEERFDARSLEQPDIEKLMGDPQSTTPDVRANEDAVWSDRR